MFRFDHFFRSRTESELNKRMLSIYKLIEKEKDNEDYGLDAETVKESKKKMKKKKKDEKDEKEKAEKVEEEDSSNENKTEKEAKNGKQTLLTFFTKPNASKMEGEWLLEY